MTAPTERPTPGPWHYDGHNVGGPDHVRIADCWTSDRPREEQLANARLIASLPKLLAERASLLADADASQHWQTRALRAEADRDALCAELVDMRDKYEARGQCLEAAHRDVAKAREQVKTLRERAQAACQFLIRTNLCPSDTRSALAELRAALSSTDPEVKL